MPRKEGPTSAADKVEKTFCSYLEVSVVNMFKDQGGRPGLGVEGKKNRHFFKFIFKERHVEISFTKYLQYLLH